MTDVEKLLFDNVIERLNKRLGDFAHDESIVTFEQEAVAVHEVLRATKEDLLQLRKSLFSNPKGKRK